MRSSATRGAGLAVKGFGERVQRSHRQIRAGRHRFVTHKRRLFFGRHGANETTGAHPEGPGRSEIDALAGRHVKHRLGGQSKAPKGRDEDPEATMSWVRHHDRYAHATAAR